MSGDSSTEATHFYSDTFAQLVARSFQTALKVAFMGPMWSDFQQDVLTFDANLMQT